MTDEKKHAHGTVRLRHEHTNEILLVPTPSNRPEDPLNWPTWFKHYVAGVISLAILLGTFTVAGPSVAIPNMAIDFFGPPHFVNDPSFYASIAKVSYNFTVSPLLMGVSNIIWIPLAVKYGRRPVYLGTFIFFTATSAWCAVAKSHGSMMAARALQGMAAGSGEVLGPLTIADIYFAHERGKMMVIYTTTLSLGVGIGSLVSGAVLLEHTWREIFWVATALIGFTTVLMFFTLPETLYYRDPSTCGTDPPHDTGFPQHTHNYELPDSENEGEEKPTAATAEQVEKAPPRPLDHTGRPMLTLSQRPPTKLPSLKSIMFYIPKSHTRESLWQLALRPIVLIALPAVLWASLIMSVSIGFLVALSTNLATSFSEIYGFTDSQSAWTYSAGVVGSLVAIFFGGHMTDLVVDFFAKKNNGLRDPEMRLPAMMLSLVTGPLSLILYGVGLHFKLHWMCPVFGLGLLNFTVVQASNIVIVYMIDCYRPIAGEVTLTQYAFKSLFGFLLSFYTNPWINEQGYLKALGEMAAISGGIFLFLFLFYFYGKKIRVITWHWRFIRRAVHWHEDREVGE